MIRLKAAELKSSNERLESFSLLNFHFIYLFIYLFCSEQENSQISVHQMTSRNSKAKSTDS